jgi:transposase
LAHQAGQVVVSNPAKTRLIAQARIKTDKFDALALARLLASGFICDVWVPVSRVREQRALAAHRDGLRKQSTRTKNRIHALLRRHNLHCPTSSVFNTEGRLWLERLELSPVESLERQQLLAQLDLVQTQLGEANSFIARRAQHDPRITRLMQIPGIGFFTAFGVLAAIGDIHRFPSPKHLSSYAGLVPSVHQSGQKHYTGHITKEGRPMLRWLMVETAHIAVRWDPHWKAVFQRIAKRRGRSVAIVAVARKLLVVIWHLLAREVPYLHLNPKSFTRKLKEWAWAIGPDELLTGSTRAFVAHQLKILNLETTVAGGG